MMIIKLSHPYGEGNGIRDKLSPGATERWGATRFFENAADLKECDYWVVFNDMPEAEVGVVVRRDTVLLTTEPETVHIYNRRFMGQFGCVIGFQTRFDHPRVYRGTNLYNWWVLKKYDDLKAIVPFDKEKFLSIVTSNKLMTEGHHKRYQLALRIKEHFGTQVDLFGRGINEFEDKWDVLAPYKYSLAIENASFPDYMTEKLVDCYLSYTFPLYHGAPNTSEYFDGRSFLAIDLDDAQGVIKQVEGLLANESHYDRHLQYLLEARRKCLDEYSLLPFLTDFAEQHKDSHGGARGTMTLRPERHFVRQSRLPPTVRKIGRAILRRG